MTKAITPDDIRDLLAGFAAAIELDQLRVDAVQPQKFHPLYNDKMWREWRQAHLDYINQLLPTVDAIPSAMLNDLARIAITYDPELVGKAMLSIFAEAASGCRPIEDCETATLFFGWLIKDLNHEFAGESQGTDARVLMMQWLPVTDPLRIAQDDECGYGLPAGFVS
jgi:hypothetical protein